MDLLHPRCAGVDVHKNTVVACVRRADGKEVQREVRTFGTTTSQLMKLSDWLQATACTHVVMEATGIFWKPIWAVLEAADCFELVLANPYQVKALPGRKSDVNDSGWLAELLAHGLVRSSFVPPRHVQEMRELSRTRRQLVQEVTSHTLRIQKLLDAANVKLSSVLSDILGESGRAILNKLVEGTTDPDELVKELNYRVKATPEEVKEALRGTTTEHHRFLLKLHLHQIDELDAAVRDLEARLGDALKPFRSQVERVAEIPGLSERSASAVLSEIGLDMSRFETPNHLVSWAGLCPRMDESAGKKRNTRIGKGGTWLKPVLVQAAWCAIRTKKCYLKSKFQSIKSRRGAKKAVIAVAASMLRAIWHLLKDEKATFTELGLDRYATQSRDHKIRRLLKQLKSLGHPVDLAAA